VEASGLELVDVGLARERGQRVLRVTVDHEGGVDLGAISEVSERISRRLDVEGFDPGPYSLEVSSPGVERPLRGPRDFDRQVGRQVKVKVAHPVEGTRVVNGRVVRAGPERVLISTDQGDSEVAYEEIASARTVVDWNAEMARRNGG
jgi:ribosome maturation factor RimP